MSRELPPLFCAESGDGEPVLLIHGLGASHRDWRDVMPALAPHYRVLAPDLRGHGSSPRQRPYNPERFAADMRALLDARGVDRVDVVGHSMGGAVALCLALCAPERVRRLVIANSVPSFRPRRPAEIAEIAFRIGMMGVLGPKRLGRIMARRMFPDPGQEAQRALLEERAERNRRGVYLESLIALSRWSVRERLDAVTMPALVIASGHDYFPVDDSERFAAELPDGRLHIFPDARHGLPLEHGEAMAEVIAAFLRE